MTIDSEHVSRQRQEVADKDRDVVTPNNSGSAMGAKTSVEPNKKRRTVLLIVLVALVVIGVVTWWLIAQNYEDTDDAQVDGHMNPITSRIAGTIQVVHVENNQHVQAGDPLIDLDPNDYEVALAQAKANLDQARADSRAENPNLPIQVVGNSTDEATGRAEVVNAEAALAAAQHDYDNAVAKLRSSEATDARAQSDLKRYTELIQKQEVAQSDYDQYTATAKSQKATVEADLAAMASAAKTIEERRAQLLEQQSKLDQTLKNAASQISIRQETIQSRRATAESSAAQFEQAKLNLGYTHIASPVTGNVTERSAEVGARVTEGQQLMMIVQTEDLWVTANFKETQLRRMHNGESVRIHVDALGHTFAGYIENMPAATGDRTSVLPPENATGNYVKVIQRLPVRIRFKPNQHDLGKLRPGMSVEPEVRLE
jgi:membrane fusion protein, multidrug efflux system